MEGGESKRKRNPETEGDQLALQKRLRSETSVDMTLPPELFQHAIALSSNNPKYHKNTQTRLTHTLRVLGVAASVCRGWFDMVLQARKEFIRTRYERQVAKISESQRYKISFRNVDAEILKEPTIWERALHGSSQQRVHSLRDWENLQRDD